MRYSSGRLLNTILLSELEQIHGFVPIVAAIFSSMKRPDDASLAEYARGIEKQVVPQTKGRFSVSREVVPLVEKTREMILVGEMTELDFGT